MRNSLLHCKGRAPERIRNLRLYDTEYPTFSDVTNNVPKEISGRNFKTFAASAYSYSKKKMQSSLTRLQKSWNVSLEKWRIRFLDVLQMLRLPVRHSRQAAELPAEELSRQELKHRLMRAYFTQLSRGTAWMQKRKDLGLNIGYRVKHSASRKMAEMQIRSINQIAKTFNHSSNVL